MRRRSTASSSRDSPRPVPVSPLPSRPEETAELLQALELTPRRGRGQNFLMDPGYARTLAYALAPPPGETVVEVGGGLGQLSFALLAAGARPLIVLEREPRLASFLSTNLGRRAKVLLCDARSDPLPPARYFAGNLPFTGASEILLRLLAAGMDRGAFLVQEEVAQRLAAQPGSRAYGRLTIPFSLEGSFRLLSVVPPEAFYPSPRVRGRLLLWERGPERAGLSPDGAVLLERLLRSLFQHRRKMLGSTLPPALAEVAPGKGAEGLLREAGWPVDWARLRAEEIPVRSYARLASILAPGGERTAVATKTNIRRPVPTPR